MKKITIYEAVEIAGCSSPEGEDTDGAVWLREVIEAGVDMERYYEVLSSDAIHETADQLVPVYTNKLWNIWVDLGGYYFDGEYRDFSSNSDTGDMMNRVAMADCYE